MEKREYYLYRHIRLDKNEVFYIGYGKKPLKYNGYRTEFTRAFSKQRNIVWNRVVAKTDYKIEILLESDNYEFIEQKEIEFIKLYGRKDLGLGTLVNLTDGGRGGTKHIVNNTTRIKRIKNLQPPKGKPVWVYDTNGYLIRHYKDCKEASLLLDINIHTIYTRIRSKSSDINGYRFFREYKGDIIEELAIRDFGAGKRKKINQLDKNGAIIHTFNSIEEAAKTLNIFAANITSVLHGRNKTSGGFKWQFV